MAWADGRLDDAEKAGVKGAAEVLNLSKEHRERLAQMLEKPLPLDHILLDTLSPRDKAFAFVAATWMSGVDQDVDAKEKALLDRLAGELGLSAERRAELERIARDLESKDGSRNWGDEAWWASSRPSAAPGERAGRGRSRVRMTSPSP